MDKFQEQIIEIEGNMQVNHWMISNPSYITVEDSFIEAAKKVFMSDIDFIPVVNEKKKPIGILTTKMILSAFLYQESNQSIGVNFSKKNFQLVFSDDSLLDIYKLAYKYFSVIDNSGALIGILTDYQIKKGLTTYIESLNAQKNSAEIVNVILDSAYEGIAVVDEHGILKKFNDAYSRFTGVDKEDAIGRHVQEVIENTNLHMTVKTGLPERGEIQYIQGQPMVVHRIPIWKDRKVTGAIGMLIFEGVTELYRIYERFQGKALETKPSNNHSSLPINIEKDISMDQIIGNSDATDNMKRLARKVAKTDATVLITGESGTGKEMFARSIHHLSPFASGPFVSVNCAAIPEQLFESELFGYDDGAFTGAKKGGKPGKFELAIHGTLFLDEIAEMPLIMQTKLLRVLQEKEFERVGGIQKHKMQTRIVAATNRNLKKMIRIGDFREDLYYRINVVDLLIPPLRERMEDIPQLISYYLKKICKKYDMPMKEITPEAMRTFLNYEWYGNIRELVNTIERLVILVEGSIIDIESIPKYMKEKVLYEVEKDKEESISPIQQAKKYEIDREIELIQDTLIKTGGNKSKAAEELGIHRTTLYQKLKKYGLEG